MFLVVRLSRLWAAEHPVGFPTKSLFCFDISIRITIPFVRSFLAHVPSYGE